MSIILRVCVFKPTKRSEGNVQEWVPEIDIKPSRLEASSTFASSSSHGLFPNTHTHTLLLFVSYYYYFILMSVLSAHMHMHRTQPWRPGWEQRVSDPLQSRTANGDPSCGGWEPNPKSSARMTNNRNQQTNSPAQLLTF